MGVVFEPYQSRNVIGESRGRRPSSARSLGTSHTRAGGHPLDASVSSLMSGAFGHDFSRVRIHADDAAARRVDSLHAEAVTIDSNIFFGSGFYQPGTIQGRRLIAHELTHVTQQGNTAANGYATEPELEREAEEISSRMPCSPMSRVRHRAPAALPLFRKVLSGKRQFEVGDISLNPQATSDVTVHKVLLAGEDQAHIIVDNNQLGYEINHTKPDDPFRWNLLKQIVDTGHVDISGVSNDTSFDVKEVILGQGKIVSRSLMQVRAGGITLPRLSIVQATKAVGLPVSPDDNRDKIYYESGAGGRGLLDSNSLAHEFYGHLSLAMRGVPWGHGQQLTEAQGITDPLGRPFAGPVNVYIESFAQSNETILQSPTLFVSPDFLNKSVQWLKQNGAAGLTLDPHGVGQASGDFASNWDIVSQNYEVLLAGQPPIPTPDLASAGQPATPSAAQPVTSTPATAPAPATTIALPALDSADKVLNWVLDWYQSTLNADQEKAFLHVMATVQQSSVTPPRRPSKLASDVLARLQPRVP